MSKILYSTDHLWFKGEKNIITIGMTDYLKSRIAPVFIQLPEVGASLESGKSAGSMESTKFACEITFPFSCKVRERNEQLISDPEFIARQAENMNWLCVVAADDDNWISDLMDQEEYQSYIEP